MATDDHARFAQLSYDDFRRMAVDESLSPYERIGFPDEYRAGHEERILQDIVEKLPPLTESGRVTLDIGPGCSSLPHMLRDLCLTRSHRLLQVDSAEMLAHHPDVDGVVKYEGRFPDCSALIAEHRGAVDAILAYSVLQYAFTDASIWRFLDAVLELLAPDGWALLGDVPNVSMRKRFFASESGRAHHREFTQTDESPDIAFNVPQPGDIDDAVVLGLMARARAAGFQAFVVPQHADLPMSNRREDILIHRP